MYKKITTSIIGLGLAFSVGVTGVALASSKLSGHWAESLVEVGFLERHFQDFAAFSPDAKISEGDFRKGLNSLFTQFGFTVRDHEGEKKDSFRRLDAAMIVADELINHGIEGEGEKLPVFEDIQGVEPDQVDKIMLLNELGIMQGDLNHRFMPEAELTQIQAIITLQRLKGVLQNKGYIPFEVIDETADYSSVEEGVTVEEKEETVIVELVKSLPHPGYSVKVDHIKNNEDVKEIYLKIQEPDSDKFYNQVITYHTIRLEINKKYLGKAPYLFRIAGEDDKLVDLDWKINGQEVESIELYSIFDEKIKEFSKDEIKPIIESLNNSKVDDRPYIAMLAGNIMIINTADSTLRITSYGSESNIVVVLEKGEEVLSQHVYCPEIAKILLDTEV